jgi:hypothetical protein
MKVRDEHALSETTAKRWYKRSVTKRMTTGALALGLLLVAACGGGYSKDEVDALVSDAVDSAVANAKDDIASEGTQSALDETTSTTTTTSTTLAESIEILAPPSDHAGWQWDVEVEDWTCSDEILECWEYVVEVEGFDNWREWADWDTYLSLTRAQGYPDDEINRANAEHHCGVKPDVTFKVIFEQMEAQALE